MDALRETFFHGKVFLHIGVLLSFVTIVWTICHNTYNYVSSAKLSYHKAQVEAPDSLSVLFFVCLFICLLVCFVSVRVVSGSRDATLRVWDIETGQCLHVLMGHVAAVRCVQYDGRRVVSGAYDFMVKVWDPETETCLHTLQGHTNRVYSLQVSNFMLDIGFCICTPIESIWWFTNEPQQGSTRLN